MERIAEALAAELVAEIRERVDRGYRSPPEWRRFAVVHAEPETVRAYLPGNYYVVGSVSTAGRVVTLIAGRDDAGWTLDDYVLPRLASGLHAGREIVPWRSEERHEAKPAPGTVTDRFGRAAPRAQADQYPLDAVCADCGGPIRCADGSADWAHR